MSRERKGKGKKKGEIKGTGNIGEAREEDSLVQHPGYPPARSPSLSPPPSNHPFSLVATPSTSSSPPASTNFQLVLSDDNESSGYFTLKPASPSKDKKLSMECKVILEKLPPSSRGKAVRGGKGRRGGTGRKFKIQDYESFGSHHHHHHHLHHHHPEENQSEAAKVEEPELVETLEQKLKKNLVLKFLL